MPKAAYSGLAQNEILAFLQGASQTSTNISTARYRSGIQAARQVAATLNGGYRSDLSTRNYSVRAHASGTGRNAYVCITKTKDWFTLNVAAHTKDQKQRQTFQKLLSVCTSASSSSSGIPGNALHLVRCSVMLSPV